MQCHGDEPDEACIHYAGHAAWDPFAFCRQALGFFDGACSNCIWRDRRRQCGLPNHDTRASSGGEGEDNSTSSCEISRVVCSPRLQDFVPRRVEVAPTWQYVTWMHITSPRKGGGCLCLRNLPLRVWK